MNRLLGYAKKYGNYAVLAGVLLVFTLLTLTVGLPGSTLILLEKIGISILLAVSLSLVVGFLGELSLGHAGFMCVGAYLGGKIAVLLEPLMGNSPLLLLVCILVGAMAAAACGVIIGIPALRLRGDYLAIVTLAFGEIVRSLFRNAPDEAFGGATGLSTPRFGRDFLFIYAFVFVIIALAVIQNYIRSKHGRAVTAIRDNEIAAKATGINVTKYKLVTFTLSAAFAGVAGVFYSFSQYNIPSATFDYNYSIEILVMVVLGGMGSINGAIISATLITFINDRLASVLTGDLAVLQNLIYALILIAIVIYNNAPSLKRFRTKYNLTNLFKRIFRHRHDPAAVADDAAKWDVVPTKIEMNEVLSVDMTPQDKKEGGKGE